jgi:RNA-directed DNA polymerase
MFDFVFATLILASIGIIYWLLRQTLDIQEQESARVNEIRMASPKRWENRVGFRLLRELCISIDDFYNIDVEYTSAKIAKRSGGTRTLRIPNPELKSIQRKFDRYLRKSLRHRVHSCAHAYQPGRSIITNARIHAGSDVIIKLDIHRFFDAITREQVIDALKHDRRLSLRVIERLAEMCWLKTGIPQGAPTSPLLSNCIMYDIDKNLLRFAINIGARYTRYADDITFSLEVDQPDKVRSIIKRTEEEISNAGFKLNKKRSKLHVLRNHQSQRICGITVNSGTPTISRQERRRLRAIKHRQSQGLPIDLSKNQIDGLDAYHSMVMNKPRA